MEVLVSKSSTPTPIQAAVVARSDAALRVGELAARIGGHASRMVVMAQQGQGLDIGATESMEHRLAALEAELAGLLRGKSATATCSHSERGAA